MAVLVATLPLLGCGGSQQSTKPDMPQKFTGGPDAKGKASQMMEATLEDPPRK